MSITKPKKGLDVDDSDDDETYHNKPKLVTVTKADRGGTDAVSKGLDMFFGGPVKRAPTVAPAPKVEPPKVEPPKVPAKVAEIKPTTSTVVNTPPPVQKRAEEPAYKAPTGISTYETLLKVRQDVFNRPLYIRKLKKIAENFDYRSRNERSTHFENVLRIAECYYSEIKKLNTSDFTDVEFPANYIAFVDNVKERKIGHFNDYNNWKKPREIFRAPAVGKYIDPNDIERGLFQSDFLVSCLASLAEKENNIKRLIEEQTLTETGFYYVRINVNGVWRYIVIDHNIPVSKDGKIVASHSYADDESDLWSTLIEKAYTKVYGSYEQYSRVQSREAYLRDLTGAPVRVYSSSDPNLARIIESGLEKGYVVQAAPSEKILDRGFNPNLTLSVLRADSGKRSIQFRSPFGSIDEKPKVSLSREGVFEVTSDEARSFINYYLVAEVHDDYSTSTIQARHHSGFFSSYSFRVESHFDGYVMVSQFDRRQFNQPDNLYAQESKVEVQNLNHYENSPIGLFLYKKEGDTATEVASGSARAKNLDVQVSLTPGEYLVFLTVNWVDRDYDFNLSVYGTELVTFKRVYNKNNPALVASGVNSQAIREGPKIK